MSTTEELTKELLEELNCNTAFTIPIGGGIAVPESVVVTWLIMAVLIIVSILLTRNLSVDNPGKVQLALEAGYQAAENFFGELLGQNGLKYLPYLISILIYIAIANLIGLIGFKPPTKDMVLRHAGNHEYSGRRDCRDTSKRRQRLAEKLWRTHLDRRTDQFAGGVYQTAFALYATVWKCAGILCSYGADQACSSGGAAGSIQLLF